MEKLPDAVVVEILSRLDDSADVACCRVAWKTFDTLSANLRSINLQWPLRRKYIESRSRVSNSSQFITSPPKTIFLNLISGLRVIESVRIGAENLQLIAENAHYEDKGDDMYLTDGGFVKEWLPRVSGDLKSLSISDFWFQSYSWVPSEVLSLISFYCHNLLELELKHARLSVVNLNPMPMLTSLTLDSLQLDDKDLSQVNNCLSNLQVLNLMDVRGLKLPKIHLLNLKTCHWTAVDSPSYVTLIAPILTTLSFEFTRSPALFVEAHMLSHFKLSIYSIEGAITMKLFENLKTLFLGSKNVRSLLIKFPLIETVENLTLYLQVGVEWTVRDFKFSLKELFCVFPGVTSLCFSSRVWKQFEMWYGSRDDIKGLKTFRGYLLIVDPPLAFSLVACVLDQCVNLVDVSLLIHCDVDPHVSRCFIRRCMAQWPKVKWRWGMWEEGKEDSWINDDIPNSKSSKKCPRKTQVPYLNQPTKRIKL